MSLATTGFNVGSFDAATAKLRVCQTNMDTLLGMVPGAISSVQSSWVLALWQSYLVSLLRQIEQVIRDVIDFLYNVFEGIMMPFTFWQKSGQWKDNVGGPLSGVAAAVDPANLTLPHSLDWTGEARDYYKDRIASQTKAAKAVSDKANGLGDVLDKCAGAGLAAYIGIGLAVASFFAEEIVEFLADLTGIGALAGIPAGALSAGKVIALLAGIVLAIGAFVTAMQGQLSALRSLDQAAGVFPGGDEWPSATT